MKTKKGIVFCLAFIFLSLGMSGSSYGSNYLKCLSRCPEQVEVLIDLRKMFFSKCEDPNVGIKDLNDIREVYKKALKNYVSTYLRCGEKLYKTFKEEYPECPEGQLKDLEDANRAQMKAMEGGHKLNEAWIDALYEVAKAKKEYSQNPTNKAKRKVEQVEKRRDQAKKSLDVASKKANILMKVFNDKLIAFEETCDAPTETEKEVKGKNK